MALLGVQLVFSMITASVLSKLSGRYSFGRWILCSRLARYLHPTDEELKKLVSGRGRHSGPKKDPKKALDDAFSVPRNIDLQLEMAPITPVDVLPLRFYTEYQWLLDFAFCGTFVFILTELYYALLQPQSEVNLSVMWAILIIGFALRVMFVVTAIYFEGEESGERIMCFVMGFFFLILAMGVLIVSEDVLEFGLERGYQNFSGGARKFLDEVGMDSAGPASLLTFRIILAVVCSLLGAFLTFPGLRLAKMHTDALRYSAGNPFMVILLHLNLVMPLLIATMWVRPITRDYLVLRNFSGRPLMSSEAFESVRVIVILVFCLLRFSLIWTHLQSHLNIAHDNISKMRREAGRISSIDLQRLVVRVYYYLCVVALQYAAPLILLFFCTLMLKTLGDMSFIAAFEVDLPVWARNASSSSSASSLVPPVHDPDTMAGAVAHFSLAFANFRSVFTPLWFRGILSFLVWWINLAWFISSAFGIVYHQYFTS
ncbi:hypothetical protein CAPTEDRAFT_175826 [Capitella teleta]|uniref:Transmembrane protein 161B n=1 Tax=Capitella teleta TaxID=283909 RepID=R7V1U0_CAPTE|nr:hypothetical protein CAPTEDRAFT_175826 [Capitella teleta]|eukprot:ELU09636.1 hypothetical protein CAPTEDRAFT_175826 [Capitella teleta]